MKKAPPFVHALLSFLIMYVVVETVVSEPRAQVVELSCGTQLEYNATVFVQNFVETMETISDQMRTNGSGLTIVGTGPDRIYGLAQCYGDLTLLDCVLCYAEARSRLPGCFPYNSGIIYLDGCYMRVANYTFFEEITGPKDKTLCGNTTKSSSLFLVSARRRAILDAAAVAPQNKGYARAQVVASKNESAYVLANCWRTVNASSCKACLDSASESVVGCLPWSEGRALKTGCYIRYSDKNFLNEEQKRTGGSKVSNRIIVAIVVSSVAVIVIGIAFGVYIVKHKRIQKRRASNHSPNMAKSLLDFSMNFKYSTLQKATGSFDEANKLGQGGYGTVYKGVLADGREIAVKRLFFNNRKRDAEFYNEINIISSVEHKNLVRLLGCSCSETESLLVYEYLPNKSLDLFIFDTNRGITMNWETRFKIITGTAEGLAYLHENTNNRIIHRDIKASNILLDSKLRAKIADFGLARTFEQDRSHISTAVAGTLGYMAPEYLAHGKLTEKADVYSFGILVLEIVTGRRNNKSKNFEYSESLSILAWKHFQQGTVKELLDPNFMLHNSNNNIKKEILMVVNVGLLCIQEIPSLRPSMSRALRMLLKTDEPLPAPSNPPFIDEQTMVLNTISDDPAHPLNSTSSPSVASISHSDFYPR